MPAPTMLWAGSNDGGTVERSSNLLSTPSTTSRTHWAPGSTGPKWNVSESASVGWGSAVAATPPRFRTAVWVGRTFGFIASSTVTCWVAPSREMSPPATGSFGLGASSIAPMLVVRVESSGGVRVALTV